jgi:serine/threonine protein kinase
MNPLPSIAISMTLNPFLNDTPTVGKFLFNGKIFPLNEKELLDKKGIGTGSFGVVYRCVYAPLKIFVALKSISILNSNEIDKIIKEAHNLQRLSHANIITCYGYFVSNDRSKVNIALEFMDLSNLELLINHKKTIPENMTSFITREILKGLDYLHKNKCFHRDIKPSNILLNKAGDIKIGDFGNSKHVDRTNEPTNTGVGTFKYFSLERLQGKEYFLNIDVWASGLVILECVLGEFPIAISQDTCFWDFVKLVENFDAKAYQKRVSPELKLFLGQCLVHNQSKRCSAEVLLKSDFILKHSSVTSKDFQEWIMTK